MRNIVTITLMAYLLPVYSLENQNSIIIVLNIMVKSGSVIYRSIIIRRLSLASSLECTVNLSYQISKLRSYTYYVSGSENDL